MYTYVHTCLKNDGIGSVSVIGDYWRQCWILSNNHFTPTQILTCLTCTIVILFAILFAILFLLFAVNVSIYITKHYLGLLLHNSLPILFSWGAGGPHVLFVE